MSQTRPRCFNDQQQENRPRKKPRTELSNDIVKDLNLKGISNMLSGREDEAEKCFSQALGQLDGNFASLVRFSYTTRYNNLEMLPISSAKMNGATQNNGSDEVFEKAQCRYTLLYVYQREEYDEGMYAYAEALPLEESPSQTLCSANLLYNVAQTYVHRGIYNEAKEWFELALLRLKAVNAGEIAPLNLVRIFHNLAYCFYCLDKNEDACRCYKKAFSICQRSQLGDYHIATAMVAFGVLLLHSREDLKGSLEFFGSALSVYRTKCGKSKEVATALNNIGCVHYLWEKYDDALCCFEEALHIRHQILGKYSIDVAATVCSIGHTQNHMGNLNRAIEYYNEFLDVKHGLGTNHRELAMIYKCMAEIHHELGELEKAKEMYEKFLAVVRSTLGPHHTEITFALNRLGNLHYEMRDLDTALKYYNEGLHIEKIILDHCHPHLLVTLMNIAIIHRDKGNFVSALVSYSDIRSRQSKSFGPNSIEVAETLHHMGLMENQLKAYAAAFEHCQAALCIQQNHYKNNDHLDIAVTLNSIGLILSNLGTYNPAKSCFTESLRIRSKLLGPDHRDMAILWYNLGTINLETGEDDIAIVFYKETLRVERLTLGEKHQDVIRTLQHLGMVHQDRGELDEALTYLNEALYIERTKEGCSNVAIGKLLNLIGNIHLQAGNVDEMMRCYTEALRLYRREGDPDNESLVIAGYNFYGFSKLHPPGAAMA